MSERRTGEDVKARVERRMATIDALTREQRMAVHDLGWNLVQTLMVHGVTSPKSMRAIVNAVLANMSSMDPLDGSRDGCVMAPREPTDAMVDAGLRATSVWLNIAGSQLTVNREKMKIRYRAMLAARHEIDRRASAAITTSQRAEK